MENFPFPLPVVESGRTYTPGSLALEIRNLQRTPENTLRSIRGPCPLVPDYGAGYPAQYGRMHGVFHAKLDNGMRDVTLIRTADKLCEQRGWERTVVTLVSGLSNEPTARFPDQFCVVGDKIVWTNGIDRARIYDGYILLPLGYDQAPGTMTVVGPEHGHAIYANSGLNGYYHPGHIGRIGDSQNGLDMGSVLRGEFRYYVQFEDIFHNFSPASSFAAVTLDLEHAKAVYWLDEKNYPSTEEIFGASLTGLRELGTWAVRADDLKRQFLLHGIPKGPEGTVARLIWRKSDLDVQPRLLLRIPDNVTDVFPDDISEAELGPNMLDLVPTPTFKVCCPYNGALVVANFPGDPGLLGISEAGRPGSFQRKRFLYPDPEGAEVTAVATWQGRLYAWTSNSVFAVVDQDGALFSQPLTGATGTVAPSSVKPTGRGVLPWLAQDGFYAMNAAGVFLGRVSEEIEGRFRTIPPSALGRATAAWSAATQEYLCAVPDGSVWGNSLILAWDGEKGGFREQKHGIIYASLCETRDARQYVFGAGRDKSTGQDNVFVLDHEVRSYSPPGRSYVFKSQWLRADPLGRIRYSIETLYVGLVESANTTITWRVYVNGRRDVAQSSGTITAAAPDVGTQMSTAVFGTTVLRKPRLFWKRIPLALPNVDSFAFDLEATDPTHLHIVSFSFDGIRLDVEGSLVSMG